MFCKEIPFACAARMHWVYIGIMENEMETTIICRGYIGIMVHWASERGGGFRASGLGFWGPYRSLDSVGVGGFLWHRLGGLR